MKREFRMALAGGMFLVLCSAAEAQYRPPPKRREQSSKGDSFQEVVDLQRFRKGNIDWDTQELIAGGLTALHEEHQRILKELEELKTEIHHLKEKRQ